MSTPIKTGEPLDHRDHRDYQDQREHRDHQTKPLTPSQRAVEAVRQAGIILDLSDSKALTAAMAEAALEGVRRSPTFAVEVRAIYEQLATSLKPVKQRARSRRVTPSAPDIELVPRKHVQPREANPGAAPDAYYLNDLYGPEQLPLALERYKLPELKLAAELVQQRNPGTKPTSKSKRDALVAYIVCYVTMPA